MQQFIDDLLDSNQKFIVFCHHKVMNDGVAEILNKCAPPNTDLRSKHDCTFLRVSSRCQAFDGSSGSGEAS